MAVLSMCSAKGGVGKTTLAVNVAAEFALRGMTTCVVDCDLNQHASMFGAAFRECYPDVPLSFVGNVKRDDIMYKVKQAAAEHEVTIIDLPAGTSELSFKAVMMSNLAVIPAQRTSLDVRDAARTAMQIAEAVEMGREIASVLVWTMVGAQFETVTERLVREGMLAMLTDPGRAVLPAALMRYDAYPAGFVHGFVPRQVAAMAGRTVPLPCPGGHTNVRIPPSAAKAAVNIAAVAEGLFARLADLAAGREPGRVVLRPEAVELARSFSANHEAAL